MHRQDLTAWRSEEQPRQRARANSNKEKGEKEYGSKGVNNTGAGKIDVYKVDVDQQQELAATFGIRSIPTIFFIPKKGDPQVQVGAMNRAQFDEAIKEILLPE